MTYIICVENKLYNIYSIDVSLLSFNHVTIHYHYDSLVFPVFSVSSDGGDGG